MGLDVSHDAWSGGYGTFTAWREALAEKSGVCWYYTDIHRTAQYLKDEGYPEEVYKIPYGKTLELDWASLRMEHYLGTAWGDMPRRLSGEEEPLLLIFTHSDCEGIIQRRFLMQLALRLEEIAPLFLASSTGVRDWKEVTERFAQGCRAAYEAGEDLEFS